MATNFYVEKIAFRVKLLDLSHIVVHAVGAEWFSGLCDLPHQRIRRFAGAGKLDSAENQFGARYDPFRKRRPPSEAESLFQFEPNLTLVRFVDRAHKEVPVRVVRGNPRLDRAPLNFVRT
jgi:hypothetical protein